MIFFRFFTFGGEACDEGGVSPMAGTDKLGPTAVLRFIAKRFTFDR
ncbi:MAG: hypothetical protein RBT11_15240 [Desulfobacterales bacterium]|nr:hypothetical protein [Desulfobacterales bacterium]